MTENETQPLIGVQLGAHSVFDEGVDHCLDLLQETAGVNALFVYSHTYQGFAKERSPAALAPDHGVPVKDPSGRNTTRVWVEPHEKYYAGTILRHKRLPGDEEYADRDVLATLIEPARKRGMKLYARVLEGSGAALAAYLPNWLKALTVDCYGRINHHPCWNNPDYRNWWLGTVEDLFKSYPLDGFQWGAERVGPLSHLVYNHRLGQNAPICFCEHCQAKGRAEGISVERARAGFRALHEYVGARRGGGERPVDGVQVGALRILLRYPEILAWEMLWRNSKEALAAQIYGAIKTISPDAQIGRHIDHQQSTWDQIYRAAVSYGEIARYSDFIKPILYHDIAGPRIKHWHLGRMHEALWQEHSLAALLEAFYGVNGYDKTVEPGLDELDNTGLSPDYVYRETKRAVDGVAGQVPIYAGIGLDVPWQGDHFPTDPDKLAQAVERAFAAGAGGIVISREYDEMRLENLRAIGKAIRSHRG
ncbi:MAG: hypothetical protein KDE19_02070 [Caldilineaceae bacterium]|nr:hypothetical protein [Caldilineaceae bacterium]